MAYLKTTNLVKNSYGLGQVLQFITHASGTRVSTTHGTSWAEPSTAYRISITPKFTSSTIVVTYYVPFNQASADSTICVFRAFRIINSGSKEYGLTSAGATNANRQIIAGGSGRPVGYDDQDTDMTNWTVIDLPSSQLAIEYGFETKHSATPSNSVAFGQTVNDSTQWGFDTDIVLTAQEVAAQ